MTDVVTGGLDRGQFQTDTLLQGSNQAVFMLVPAIGGRSPASGPDGTVLTVTGTRLFRQGRITAVLVGDRAFAPLDPDDPASPPGTVRTDTQVEIELSGLTPSATPYPIRVRANGAESLEETFAFEVTP
jgi:hypothetical protein